ncbi:3638_t:CDS:2 [Funneliformis caledonium]|uniref:3638_t:CDS:1 n=1 Tax=Funneliformis caledonium TaxID=1117310 RepID=A0A9N9G105_9GLOM|nr:3638_t:CDS:2 [Funneliformis caledonium]
MSEKRLKLAAQGLRKTAISLQAAVVSLLQAAEALTSETDDSLVDNNPLDINLQDLLKGNINGALSKLFGDALNNEGETLDKDQKAQQNDKQPANGVKRSTRKPRPPRDPNAPTKPQNAFILFQKDVANSVKAENQGKPCAHEVEENEKSTKRSKKRTSNDEEHRKIKKHSRDEKSKEDFDVSEEIKYEREDGVGDEFESSSKTSKNKKRNKKTKKI